MRDYPDLVGAVYRERMDDEAEREALAEVTRRLAERHPNHDEAVVEKVVLDAHGQLTGPIRDFVPVLVEHAAHDRLRELERKLAAEGGPASW